LEYPGRNAAALARGWLRLGVLAAGSLLAAVALAAPPFPANSCAGDRDVGSLVCTSNDITIADITVTSAGSCIAGTTVNLDMTVNLQVGANQRYNVGVFIAGDGKRADISAANGGSSSCSVFSTPFSPLPFNNVDGNACGDIAGSNTVASVNLTNVPVLCQADINGFLVLPAVVTWENNAGTATSCQAPVSQWVQAGTKAKCNVSTTTSTPVVVLGSITINKTTAGGNGTFNYTGTGTGITPFAITTVGGTGTNAIGNLATNNAVYTITESGMGGFALTGLSCSSGGTGNVGTATATITLTPANPNVTCTYTNSQPGSIAITKNTVGGDGTFGFTGTGTGISPFSITTVGATGTQTFTGLGAGAYTITENLPAGYDLTALSCSGGTASTDLATRTATITLGVGGSVLCTFTDTKRGSITTVKNTNGGDGTFNFTGTGSGVAPFSITTVNNVGSNTIGNLVPGAYTIAETVPAGWSLTGLACTDPSNNSTGNIGNGTATINVGPGEGVVCTFVDTQASSIVINKSAVGGNSTFSFTSTVPGGASFPITTVGGSGSAAFNGVAPGTYTVTEAVPAGWSLTALSCADPTGNSTGNVGTATATIDLAAGETISCTFTDTAAGPPPPPVSAAEVPTLAEWALIMLTMLLLVTGWHQHRRRQ
jgi:hypothetical protein